MKSTIIMAIIIVAFANCKKGNDLTPLVKSVDLFDNIVAAHQSVVQTYNIDAAAGGLITGENGTKITFPPNAFVDAASNPVNGNISIKLRESLTKDKWLMDGLSTITEDNQLLQSGGMIGLNAEDASGNIIELDPQLKKPRDTGGVTIEMPKPPVSPNVDMTLWQSEGPKTWAPANYFPFGQGPNSYIFQLPGFTWVNCDGLWNDPRPKTTVQVVPDFTNLTGATDVQVFFVYRNINTCITLPPITGYWESYTNSIPVGSTADVVVIGKAASGQVIFKVLPDVVFTSLMNITLTPELSTGAAVDAYLNSIK